MPDYKQLLAIDGGSFESGYVIWNGKRVIQAGIVLNEQMLVIIGNCAAWGATGMAIEKVMSHGMAMGQSVIDTAYWEGRFVQEYEGVSRSVAERVSRVDVRKHMCFNGLAKDPEIARALKDRFGEKPTKKTPNPVYGDIKLKDDEWQAFALAVTVWDRKDE